MKTLYVALISIIILLNTSCDPFIDVEYTIVNNTNEDLEVKIFGLRDMYHSVLQEYDTVIARGGKVNIYRHSSLGSDYINPADTITIFDSILVAKNSIKAKSNFKQTETWGYSEKEYKYGGGHYVYTLNIKNDDF